jgi:hypothetical protein
MTLHAFFMHVLEWSEVWALLIPLVVLALHTGQPSSFRPIIVYIWLALFLNLSCDVIAAFKTTRHFPAWLQSNNPIYNIHSIIRLVCFSYFFISLKYPYYKTIRRLIPAFSILFISIDFTLFERFFDPERLSGNLLAAEAYFLLIFCLLYYLSQLRSEDDIILMRPDFWVVTGLCIYVVINFFVFLFYNPMLKENITLAINIWNVHNIAYIILCIFIAKAFYATARH